MNKVLKIMQHKTHTWIILTQGVAYGTFRGHKHMNESELINKHLAWFFFKFKINSTAHCQSDSNL